MRELFNKSLDNLFIKLDIQKFAFSDKFYTYWYALGTGQYRFYFVLTETVNIPANSSSLAVKGYIQVDTGSEGSISFSTLSFASSINGSYTNSSQKSKTFTSSSSYLIGTITHTIKHNADGTKSVSWKGRGRPYYSSTSWDAYTATKTVNLETIPRYATINTYTATVSSPKQIDFTWATDVACSAVYYSINNGTNWSASVGSGKSGSFSVSTLTPNTTYPLKIKVTRTDSGLDTILSALSKTTYALNTISSDVNFNIGTDLTLTIVKAVATYYSKLIISYSTNGTDYTELRGATTIASSGTTTDNYVVTLSSEELNTLYNAIPTTSSIYLKFNLESFSSGDVSYGTLDKVGTGTIVDANPIFTNFTYEDTNATTIALTGSNQKIVKGYSNLKAVITTANKAVAQKGATMVSYQLVVGEQQTTASYSAGSTVNLSLNGISNNVFIVYAIDSRGNSTYKQLSPSTYINYTNITLASVSAARTDGISDETTLTANGLFFDDTFGSVDNSVSATYRYKKTTDVSYTSGLTAITPTEGTGIYDISQAIRGDMATENLGFNPSFSYNIELTGSDELSSAVLSYVLGSGTPNIAISENGVAIMQSYDDVDGGALQVAGNVLISGNLNSITPTELSVLDGITSTTAELNILDGVTANKDEINILDGATLSTTELNYVDGVTSAIQTQFDNLEDLFQIVNYTFASGVQSAGAKGNISFSMTIPDGYTSIGAHVSSNQIANLGGAQFTPAYNYIGTTGTQTIYVWYYFPTAVKPSRYVDFKLICIKTAYYNAS